MQLKGLMKIELIGSDIEVIDAKNKSLIGLKGKIIDETKNTFVIETEKNTKRLLKEQIKFKINLNKKQVQIDGKLLLKRPEDRIKK